MGGEKKIFLQSLSNSRVNGKDIGIQVGRTFPQLEFHMVDLERNECLLNYSPSLIKFMTAYTVVAVANYVYVLCGFDPTMVSSNELKKLQFQPPRSLPKLFFGSSRLDLRLDQSQDEVWSAAEVHASDTSCIRICISLLGKLYSFGFLQLKPEVLNADVDLWEPLPCLPPHLQGCSVSTCAIPDPSNNCIYLCLTGGQLSSPYLYTFTPLDNGWTPLVQVAPDFYNKTRVAAVVDDIIYFNSRKFPSLLRAFDIVNRRWLTVTWSSTFDDGVDMNGFRMEFDALLHLGGKVLCLAGWTHQYHSHYSVKFETEIYFRKFRVYHNPIDASVCLSPISFHKFVLPATAQAYHFVAV